MAWASKFTPRSRAQSLPAAVSQTRAPELDFEELVAGGGFSIPLTEERGITIPQLGSLLMFFEEKMCGDEVWLNRKGEKLECSTADLYDIVEYIVKPATQKKQCSYVEMVATGSQRPKWFVSHWWGQKVSEFVRCLLQHSGDRVLEDEAPYWVCAYAAIQWTPEDAPGWVAPDWVNMYASNQWYDPESSPFQKAMRLSEGTVSIIDSGASYFKRVWCCYEIWSTLMLAAAANLYGDLPVDGQGGYKYDIYTCVGEDRAVGLTDGFAPVDMRRAKHWWTTNKYHREKTFPIEMAHSALSLKLELGQASQETDRIHILNSIVGCANLDAKPPKEHARYNQLNSTLHGRFAAALWRKALESYECMGEYGQALATSGLGQLALSFDSCSKLDDLAARALATGLAQSIKELDLDFNGCVGLSDDGVEALASALPSAMRQLKIDLSGCKQVGNSGMKALGNALRRQSLESGQSEQTYQSAEPSEVSFSLASEAWVLVPLLKDYADAPAVDAPLAANHFTDYDMEDLSLSFAGCGQLSEDAIIAVVHTLPQKLRKLVLNFYGCVALGDDFLEAVAAALPCTVQYIELRVARCPDISDTGVQALVKRLPPGLRHLVLDFRFCVNLTDSSALAIAEHLPLTLKYLETDFVSCSGITGETEEVLQNAVTKLSGLKFTFWGKDDFAVNM